MTTFVSVDHPTEHPGVRRAQSVFNYVRESHAGQDGSRGLSVVLLAALVAALVAVADKLVANWTDGSLVAAWMVLWVVAFFGLALFSGVARSAGTRIVAGLKGLQRRSAEARADARFLETAQRDPRVMHELRVAMARQRDEQSLTERPALSLVSEPVQAVRMPTVYEAMRRMNSARYY